MFTPGLVREVIPLSERTFPEVKIGGEFLLFTTLGFELPKPPVANTAVTKAFYLLN
jgi:hypothetical protein